MSKARQEPELESLKASNLPSFQQLVTPASNGWNYVVVALIWQVGRNCGRESGMFRRQSHAKAGISPLQSGVPRFSEAEDRLGPDGQTLAKGNTNPGDFQHPTGRQP